MQIDTNGLRLGQQVEEVITGFKGTITGFVTYLTGCNQALVVPHGLTTEGKPREAHWYDITRLRGTEAEDVALPGVRAEERGCDLAPPVR